MKKKVEILFLVFFFLNFLGLLILPQKARAHVGIPFVNINEKRTVPNPILAGSSFFKLANEFGPEDYVLGTKLNFSIDTKLIPVSPDTVGENNFSWNFGDDQTATGLNASHNYSKTGSYIVVLNAKDPASGTNFELESIRINLVPKKNYSLPQAIIAVDGRTIIDPLKEIVKISSGQKIALDAKNSKGKIKTYLWDLGDGSPTVKDKTVTHNFTFGNLTYTFTLFPILRVTDENGLVADTYVQLSGKSPNQTNNQNSNNSTGNTSSKPSGTNYLPFITIGVGILILTAGFVFLRINIKKR